MAVAVPYCCRRCASLCGCCVRWSVPAGNEGSVDKLLKQIGGFMSDIAGEPHADSLRLSSCHGRLFC